MEAAVEARTELVPVLRNSRDVLYLDLALENVVRAAAERGAGGAGAGAAAFIAPLLQNLALSLGDNEEVCYCLKAWLELPEGVRRGQRPNKDDALRVGGWAGRGSRGGGTRAVVGEEGRRRQAVCLHTIVGLASTLNLSMLFFSLPFPAGHGRD